MVSSKVITYPTSKQTESGSTSPFDPDRLRADTGSLKSVAGQKMKRRRRYTPHERRRTFFVKGPLRFDMWIADLVHPADRLLFAIKAFMDMEQRDELVVSQKVLDLANIGSRKQYRTAIDALEKMPRVEVRRRTGKRPVVRFRSHED